jgi:3-deoxy-D-manno-octulosonate 8-phosphate phosphatase (KDO 8-P phosphatase)
MKNKIKYFIIDVDGVMTTGKFFYSSKGKELKEFGPHDSDGLKLIDKFIKILFVTADKRGFLISKKRIVDDLGYSLKLLTENNRYEFIKKIGFKNVIYMGDGYYDSKILGKVYFGIAPKNARIEAKKKANYITPNNAGNGAVMDACLKIKKLLVGN